MDFRARGKELLDTVLESEDAASLDKMLAKQYNNNRISYLNAIYEILCDVQASNRARESFDKMKISDHTTYFNHSLFNDARRDETETDKYLETPLQVVEGALECKCGSKKVLSYQSQTRSADEGTTTFAECVECRAQWKE